MTEATVQLLNYFQQKEKKTPYVYLYNIDVCEILVRSKQEYSLKKSDDCINKISKNKTLKEVYIKIKQLN